MGEFPSKKDQFLPGQSGNPAGKPRGTKHIATWIQELLHDEDFDDQIIDARAKDKKTFKGAPIKAIIAVAILRGLEGDHRAWEWLAKYGYGQRLEVSSDSDPVQTLLQKYGLMRENDDDRENDNPVSGPPESSS